MTTPPSKPDHCRVIGGEKLPAETGGPQVLCAAVEAAARERAPGASFTVELRVLSPHSLAATVRMEDGRTLPEQKMAVNDRQLNRGSIDRFAASIAIEIAGASGR